MERLEARDLPALVVGPIVAAEGTPFDARIATFASGDVPGSGATDFSAMVDWGDGSGVVPATVTSITQNTFRVDGSHTYARDGAFTLTVAVQRMSGPPVIRSGVARVSNATLTATGVPISAEAGRPFAGVVATVADTNPSSVPGDFSATIDWGDGTPPTPGTLSFRTGAQGFDVSGVHTYAQPGIATTRVTVVRTAENQVATATATATAAAPSTSLGGAGTTITPIAGVPFEGVVVAAFHVTSPVPPGNFVATIDWGDGQTSAGEVVPIGDGNYQVLGSHVYGLATTAPRVTPTTGQTTPGTGQTTTPSTGQTTTPTTVPTATPKTIKVTVIQPFSAASLKDPTIFTSQALIQAPPFVGRLDPSSDTGASHDDGFTRLNQLEFSGTARPFSLVQLYARRPDQLGPVLLGRAAAGGDGTWAIFCGPLADGRYTVTATVTPPDGSPVLMATLPPVTIDTVAPEVTAVGLTRSGRAIQVGFRDDLSGMDLAGLGEEANYNLVDPGSHRPASLRHPASATAAALSTNPRAAVVTLHLLASRSRPRSLQIVAGAVADLAGNPLRGGTFVARLGTGRLGSRAVAGSAGRDRRPGRPAET